MNIATSGVAAPNVISAGPITTHEMMNDAVTGTASPRTHTATAANTTVNASTTVGLDDKACAAFTNASASSWPSPVLVIVDVITPAAAHTATTGSAPRMPSDNASTSSRSHASRPARRSCWKSLAANENSAATPDA